MIVIGAVLLVLVVLAFAGRDLGVGSDDKPASGWECVLFCLLLVGIAVKHHNAKRDEDEF